MYTITTYQGYDMPKDIELQESYEGEASEIILQSFIDEGMFSEVVYTVDEIDAEEIAIEASEWLSAEKVAMLKALEKNATDAEWEALTVQSLTRMLSAPINERKAA